MALAPAEEIHFNGNNNLLACKRWWRVCFLYGDQQKYYRQVYGRAACQRLAASASENTNPTLFPAKQSSRRRTRLYRSDQFNCKSNSKPIRSVPRVSVGKNGFEDEFQIGLNEPASNSEDSGIDNSQSEKVVKCVVDLDERFIRNTEKQQIRENELPNQCTAASVWHKNRSERNIATETK